jgi:hypothetical protein
MLARVPPKNGLFWGKFAESEIWEKFIKTLVFFNMGLEEEKMSFLNF